MKKLYSAVVAAVVAVMMWSCGPAEFEYKEQFTLRGLYTVNKATVALEFSDTMLFVRNIDEYELETGDRALLLLHCFYDAYSGQAPQWNIREVIKRIPVYQLSKKSDIDTAAYVTPVTGLQPLDYFHDFETSTWVWNEKQNISIKYKGVEDGASFALAVRGVKDGYVDFELYVNAPESDKETSTLLTFDIADIADYVSDEEKALLTDSIKTRIFVKRMNNGVLADWMIDGNKIVNLNYGGY